MEKSGTALLRSLCKLAHRGWGAYAKGDGEDLYDQLIKDAHEWAGESVGRVELSKRQDWCLEVCSRLFCLVDALIKYTDGTRTLDENVLRDSCLQRLELLHFQAYIHVGAIMWDTAFKELRALTNSTTVELNPLQLNETYDHLWAMGEVLMGDTPFDVLAEGYRPWPEVEAMRSTYTTWGKDELAKKRLEQLRGYASRADAAKYVPILKEVLALFGKGIHESLTRTMGDYLEATDGCMAQSKLEPWMKARAVHLLAHNNHAERPFAVMKFFDHLYQTMTLANLKHLSMARCNSTFKRAPDEAKTKKTQAKAAGAVVGAAVTAAPVLKAAVSAVSSVRRNTLGEVTVMRRNDQVSDQAASTVHRQKHRAAQLAKKNMATARKASLKDTARSTALVVSVVELSAKLAAKSGKGTTATFLSLQIDARVVGRRFEYPLSVAWDQFRSSHFKARPIKKTPSDGEDDLEYKTRLLTAMITHDVRDGRYSAANLAAAHAEKVEAARELPVISEEYTCSYSMQLKADGREAAAALMDVDDDEDLVQLEGRFEGKVLYENDAGQDKTWKVLAVQYDERTIRGKFQKYFEATIVQLERDESGGWSIPKSCYADGEIRDCELDGIILLDVTDPDAKLESSDADDMIRAHEEREKNESRKRERGGGSDGKDKGKSRKVRK